MTMTADVNKLKCLYFDLIFKDKSKDQYGYVCSETEEEALEELEQVIDLIDLDSQGCAMSHDDACRVEDFLGKKFPAIYRCPINECVEIVSINCSIIISEKPKPIPVCTQENTKIKTDEWLR